MTVDIVNYLFKVGHGGDPAKWYHYQDGPCFAGHPKIKDKRARHRGEEAVDSQDIILKPVAHAPITATGKSIVLAPTFFTHTLRRVSIFTHIKHTITKPTLPRARKKEPDNKNLQRRHAHHKRTLNNAEPENPTLGTAHGAEIAVLARPEVLLVARYGG